MIGSEETGGEKRGEGTGRGASEFGGPLAKVARGGAGGEFESTDEGKPKGGGGGTSEGMGDEGQAKFVLGRPRRREGKEEGVAQRSVNSLGGKQEGVSEEGGNVGGNLQFFRTDIGHEGGGGGREERGEASGWSGE